ncbi:hypothetical protein QKW35_08150 [Pontibacterium granulatum]|uniref:ABC-three component system middle component 1 n=1 Tax=Pontibacterium granulatum TaxID=2036029 RepID=UPI00249A21AF|nr:ABC-three component system middle component 1 [Pontibacterium granulatum]MDI3324346.1 hypothetical protein [Pontibacterium granulatum]
MLTIPDMAAAIEKRAEGRYEVAISNMFELVSPSTEIDSTVLRLKRVNQGGAGWRTVLIAAFPFDLAKIQIAFRWAADVRDLLEEPQTADLYMFMAIEGITSEDAARLEADDRFCRKIVVREQEDVDSFLDRGFLATLSPSGSTDTISDPLLASLGSMVQVHSWVEPHLDTWRELLLSGRPGGDIAEALKVTAYGDEDSQ